MKGGKEKAEMKDNNIKYIDKNNRGMEKKTKN